MSNNYYELLGWCGMLAIIGAYTLVSFALIPSNGFAYHFLNLFGALGLLVVSVKKGIKQTIALNIFWAAVALVTLVGLWKNL